ncbi:unannotated protein [freshwater metagenome]
MAPAEYDAILVSANGRTQARHRFTVVAAGARPTIRVAKRAIRSGASIRVSWSGAPGWRNDWVSVSKAGDPDVVNYIGYVYTGAHVNGSETITADDLGKLKKGRYVVRLLRDDHYDVLAQTSFSVR